MCAEVWREARDESWGAAAHGESRAGAGPCGRDPGGPGNHGGPLGVPSELPPCQVLDAQVRNGLLSCLCVPVVYCKHCRSGDQHLIAWFCCKQAGSGLLSYQGVLFAVVLCNNMGC